MSKFLFRSYVALGDSLTEGLGDFDFEVTREGSGWADRVAQLLALRARAENESFAFANFALRGSATVSILTAQLEDALKLKPDLVTIMAGANDLSARKSELDGIRALFRGAITRLHEQGSHVILLTPINTRHLKLFTPYVPRAKRMADLVREIAAEFDVPVLNVFGISTLQHLQFWARDMVHFSGLGHIEVANRLAHLLGLDEELRFEKPQVLAPSRGLISTLAWIGRDVAPFFLRAIRGVTSGDFIDRKHNGYVQLVKADAMKSAQRQRAA